MAYRFKHGDRPVEGYTIQRAIGAGGFGEVYYAVSDGGREVALKYLRDNPEIELRGVSACMNLKSPHLVSIFDVRKSVDGEYFILMEYCSGPSLRDLLVAETNGLGEQKAAFFVREIAKGLAYLHDRGVVHRDLKPGNIFYDDGYVKIGDYGLSKFMSISRHSGQTASVGTVHYMAPEIGSGDYGRGVDIYALGVMLYEMLLGRVPFEGSSMGEVLMKHLTSQPEVDQLPDPYARVIRRALMKDPRERYQTVDEMVSELLEVEQVQQSLAGFSAKSLEGAVRAGPRGGTPMPSPNPKAFGADFRPAPPRANPVTPAPLPEKLQRRIDRISRKVEDRVTKLGGPRRGGPPPLPRDAKGKPGETPPLAEQAPEPTEADRRKRLLLAGMTFVVSGVIVAVSSGVMFNHDEAAFAGLGAAFATTGMVISRRAIDWLGSSGQAGWVQRFVTLLIAGTGLTLGLVPMLDSRLGDEGCVILFGVLAVILVLNWRAAFLKGHDGQLPIKRAVGVAILAGIFAAPFAAGMSAEPQSMVAAAMIAAALVINVHVFGWSLPRTGGWGFRSLGRSDRYSQERRDDEDDAGAAPADRGPGSSMIGGGPFLREEMLSSDSAVGAAVAPHAEGGAMRSGFAEQSPAAGVLPPFAYPVSMGATPTLATAAALEPRRRSTAARIIWALLTFALFSGSMAAMVYNIVERIPRADERILALAVCIGCAAGAFFTVTKTTRCKRRTVWRETLWPLGTSMAMAATGVCISLLAVPMGGMARPWLPAIITLLVISGLGLLVMIIAAIIMLVESLSADNSSNSFLREAPSSAGGTPHQGAAGSHEGLPADQHTPAPQ